MKKVRVGLLGIVTLLMMLSAMPAYAQVQRPRDTNNTRTADRALEDGDKSDDPAERTAKFQQALASAQAEIAENANNPLGYRLAALASLALEQYAEAGRYFDQANELYPLYIAEDMPLRENTWIDLYQKASPFIESGDYEAAAEIFEDANAIFQGRPEVMVTLAQIYASINQLDKSIEYMDKVDEFMASDAAAATEPEMLAGWKEQADGLLELRAQVLAAAGRLEEAVATYQKLRERDPSNSDYTLRQAMTLMDLDRKDEALELYGQLLDSPNVSGAELYAIGVGFYQVDDFDRAVRGFSGAVAANPRDRDAIEMWARTLQLDSAYAEIPPIAERWLELDPNSQSGWAILAQSANASGDTETTQQAMNGLQSLQVAVEQLELQRFGSGGGVVAGAVMNKTLEPGATVTLSFTFYGEDDSPMGSLSVPVTVGDKDVPVSFEGELSSQDPIGGYSYTVTVG